MNFLGVGDDREGERLTDIECFTERLTDIECFTSLALIRLLEILK